MMNKFFRKIKYLIKYPLSYISSETEIGKGAKIKPFVYISGKVKIGKNCEIGPFSRIREITEIKDNVFIGHFVEIKNSFINENTKVGHLAYIGDAQLGKNVNIGAGVITCNYDGKDKHKTIIGNNAFIGTNNSLVAPVVIGESAYTAAGSVITEDVPSYGLGIGRARQTNKEMWVKKRQLKNNSNQSKIITNHTNELNIRKKQLKDIPVLIKITQDSFPCWFKHIPYLLFEVLVAEKQSQIIGFVVVSTNANTGKIDLMAVDKNYRGQNIGETLLEKTFDYFRAKEKKYCLSKVRTNNPKALHFYEKNGFKVKKMLKRSILGNVFLIKKDL